MGVPDRPRLIDDAQARRHVVDGREKVIVFVSPGDLLFELEPRQWTILEVADGTRDVEGITLAARRLGAGATIRQVLGFLGGLADRGLLTDGPPEHHPEAVGDAPRPTPPERRVEPLPGYSLHCDGSGGCCRFFGTVLFAPADRARARGLLPAHRVGPIEPERVFTWANGSASTPISVPAFRDGACGFLEDDGRCAIHRAGGLEAKPSGCASFPLRLIDDGDVVRATAVPECGCVIKSGGRRGGTELVAGARTVADLPKTVVVRRLPDEIVFTPTLRVQRKNAVAWSNAHREWGPDPAAALWAGAAALATRGLEAPVDVGAAPPAPALVRPWIDALARQAGRRAERDARWRSKNDVIRSALGLVFTTVAVLREEDALRELLASPPAHPEHEATYLRTLGWGHGLLLGNAVVDNLRDRAVRLWIARAMQELRPDPPPLAVVDVLMRAHALVDYVAKSGSTGSSGNSTPGNA